MSTLLQKANAIKIDKDTNLKPETLKLGTTCLGVHGKLVEAGALSVFTQEHEPTSKDGVWIRTDEENISSIRFSNFYTPVDTFISVSDVSYLKDNIACACQVIIDGWLYSIASNGNSKKYNLSTKQSVSISTRNLGNISGATGCYYDGLIYIFYSVYGSSEYSSYAVHLYKYNPFTGESFTPIKNILSSSDSLYRYGTPYIYANNCYILIRNITW